MSEAALRAAVPPHFSKDSPCWAIFSELKGIRNKLEQIAHAKTHSVEDLQHYRQMLNAIDARRGPGGIFAGHIDHDDPNKTIIPEGQAVCSDELAATYTLLESLTDSAAPMSAPMLEIRDQLAAIKARLGQAAQSGSSFKAIKADQEKLDAIDAERLRRGGVFAGDLSKGEVPAGQAVLSDMLAQCYREVERVKSRTEP